MPKDTNRKYSPTLSRQISTCLNNEARAFAICYYMSNMTSYIAAPVALDLLGARAAARNLVSKPVATKVTRTFEEILQEGSQKLNRLINEAKVDPRKALAPVMGKKVEIDWSSVRDVNISGHAMGGSSQGVFVMKINGERQAVKISTPGSQGNLLEQPGYIEAIQIQRILGDMGYAPKLFEIYEGENLKRVINQINSSTITNKIPVESKGLRYGIRMEEIQDVWVYDRAEDIAPFFKNWNKDQLTLAVNRIRELENVVNRLHISAGDAQIFLSPDGRIILGDLDFYRMSKGPGQNDFTGLIQELLNKWEIRHGSDAIEQLTPAERAKFLYPELKG